MFHGTDFMTGLLLLEQAFSRIKMKSNIHVVKSGRKKSSHFFTLLPL